MDRRQFLHSLASAGVAAAQTSRPLNFIFILADDWGGPISVATAASLTTRQTSTDWPHRGLATQGIGSRMLTRHVRLLADRASILTGRYPARLQFTDWIPAASSGQQRNS
jgi:arylsulfatase A-like enzyme